MYTGQHIPSQTNLTCFNHNTTEQAKQPVSVVTSGGNNAQLSRSYPGGNTAPGNVPSQMNRTAGLRIPLNIVHNNRENQFAVRTMNRNGLFSSWDDWWSRWRKLKKSDTMEEMRAKTQFYRCMSYDCPYSVGKDGDFLNHLLEVHAEEDIVCSYCLKSFTPEELITHSEEHLSNVYQCPECIYRASSPTHIVLHQKEHHKREKSERAWKCSWAIPNLTVQFSVEHVQPYRCTNCSFQSRKVEEFGLHQAVHPSECCFECKATTSSFNDLLHHLRKHGINDYHCHFCIFGAETREDLSNHICVCHPEKPVTFCSRIDCTTINQEIQKNIRAARSKNNENETNLQSWNGGQERVVDQVQRKRPTQQGDVGRPLPDNSKQANKFPCGYCKESFQSKRKLLDHLFFSHNCTEPHICFVCMKYFDNQNLLEQHNSQCQIPGRVAPSEPSSSTLYICVFCNWTSTVYTEMRKHLLSKVKERNRKNLLSKVKQRNRKTNAEIYAWLDRYLQCQTQDASAGLVPSLMHEKVEENVCPMCLLKCASATEFKEHLCAHLQYSPYKCSKCPTYFVNYEKAMRHADSKHAEQLEPFKCVNLLFIEKWIMEKTYSKNAAKWPPLYCGHCQIPAKKVSTLLNHFKKDHPNVHLDIRGENYVPVSGTKTDPVNGKDLKQVTGQGGQLLQLNNFTTDVPENSGPSQLATSELLHISGPNLSPERNEISNAEQIQAVDHIIQVKSAQENINVRSEIRVARKETTDSKESDCEVVNLVCPLCSFETADLHLFKKHSKSKHKSKRSPSKMSSKQTETHYKSPKKHSTKKAKSSRNADSKTGGSRPNRSMMLKCPLCKSLASSTTRLNHHMKKKHPSSPKRTIHNEEESDSDEAMKTKLLKRKRQRISSDSSNSSESPGKKIRKSNHMKSSSNHASKNNKVLKPSGSNRQHHATNHEEAPAPEVHEEAPTPEVYWSNYGQNPQPVNTWQTYFSHQNPSGRDPVRVPLSYYHDVFYRRVPRVILFDCKYHFGGLPGKK